jgi:hypothetical protein
VTTFVHPCKLKKVQSPHQNVRTEEMEGLCDMPPTVGLSFQIMNDKPLEKGYTNRLIMTSPVMTAIREGGKIRFFTESGSEYIWEDMRS